MHIYSNLDYHTIDIDAILYRMFDVDPEARPSVTQLLEMAKAIHMGKPLPPYEISNEAKLIKAERELEEQQRAALQRKKGASKESFNAGAGNRKQEGQKIFSSAAAKRLGIFTSLLTHIYMTLTHLYIASPIYV